MPRCPVCRSNKFIVKKKTNCFDLGVCSDCGLAFADPLIRGANDDVGQANSSVTSNHYYSSIKEDYDKQCSIAINKSVRMLNYWSNLMGRTPQSILDIGCGTGAYYMGFNKLNVDWHGIDVNKDMVDFCKSHGVPVLNIDMTKDRINKKFDIVFSSQVLEHVFEPNLFLESIWNLLSDNGLLHMDVPNHESLMSLYRRLNIFSKEYGFLQPNHHLIAYNKNSLSRLLEKNRFNILHLGAYPNDHNIMGQLLVQKSPLFNIVLRISKALGRSSLLVVIAKKRF